MRSFSYLSPGVVTQPPLKPLLASHQMVFSHVQPPVPAFGQVAQLGLLPDGHVSFDVSRIVAWNQDGGSWDVSATGRTLLGSTEPMVEGLLLVIPRWSSVGVVDAGSAAAITGLPAPGNIV